MKRHETQYQKAKRLSKSVNWEDVLGELDLIVQAAQNEETRIDNSIREEDWNLLRDIVQALYIVRHSVRKLS